MDKARKIIDAKQERHYFPKTYELYLKQLKKDKWKICPEKVF